MTTKVTFTLPAHYVGDAETGIILGDFNNWNVDEGVYLKKKSDGSMAVDLKLAAGKTYQYRYLLSDGRWVNDDNSKTQAELFGYPVENCVITVPAAKTSATVAKKAAAPKKAATKAAAPAKKKAAPKKK